MRVEKQNGLPAGASTASLANKNITVTPTATTTYTLTAINPVTNCNVAAVATATITVNQNSTISQASAGGTEAQTVCIHNAVADINYVIGGGGTGASITSGSLPAGVTGSFSGGQFTITGTPTQSGVFNYTVTTAGPCINNSLSGSITVNANSTISLSSATGSDAQTVCINNAISNINYNIGGGGTGASITSGALPTGVTGSFSGAVFTISGTPTQSGVFNYTVTTAGPCINSTLNGSITVNANSTVGLASATGTDAQVVCINNAISNINYNIGGGGTGASITSGALPTGVTGSYNAGVFAITGIPSQSGVFNYTVTTTGPCLNTSLSGSITVTANATIGLSSAAGTDEQSVCFNSSITNITYSIGGSGTSAAITEGALPAGVSGSFNAGIFSISGTPLQSGTFNYTITTTGPCVNSSLNGTLTVYAEVPAPLSGGNQTVCEDGNPNQTLTATATGGTITWYDASTNGNVVAPVQVGVGTSTHYAEASTGTCSSLTRTAVTLTINAAPAAPIAGNQTVCSDGTTNQTLTATATGGIITWYDAAVEGNVVSNPLQTGVGTSTYYAESSNGTCTSITRTAVILTINPVPAAPVSGGNQTVCEDGSPTQTLTAVATGGTITWYNAATNGNLVAPTQVGVGTATYYAEASDGTCSSLTRTAVILTINAAPAAPTASNQTVCSDGTLTQTLTATATGGTIAWYDTATNGHVVTPTQVGVGTSTYYAESSNESCTSLTRTAVTLTINPVPAAPVSGGNQTVCSDGSLTQTLTATASGGTITWYDAATNGNVITPTQVGVGTSAYYAQSSDGTCASLTRTAVTLTINPLPASAIVSIAQPDCTTATGTITVTAPTGTGLLYSSGGGYQSSPIFTSLAAGTYNIGVRNNFGCFSATPTPATVVPQPVVPGPATITGVVNICPYIGTGEQITYTASALGASAYNWTIPSNVTIIAGQGTANLAVAIGSGFSASQPNKQFRVVAVSACGSSAPAIFVVVAQSPNTPGPITGPTDICGLIGTNNTATYKINKVVAATSYTWTTPAGLSSVVHPNGPGSSDTVIVVTFGSSYATGNIKVAAFNECGSSGSVRSINIPRTPASTPGLITGSTNACAYMLPDGSVATYSILPVTGATSYTWTTPINAVVTHPNGTGANDYTITVQYPSGFTSGTISVTATNGCGTSGVRSLAINKLNPATPSIIDVIQEQVCPNRVYSYTISGVPANSTQLIWTFPAAGTKISETATSISVAYPPTSVVGTVTVQSVNNCGTSTVRSTPVKLGLCAQDGRPAIAGKESMQPETLATQEKMDVKVFPNPAVSDFNLQVLTAGKQTINVRVLDMQGREFKRLTIMPYQTIHIGADLKAGTYIIETRQGSEVKTVKLIKF